MRLLLLFIFLQIQANAQTYEATYQFEVNKEHFRDHIKKKTLEGSDPTLLKKAFARYLNSRPAKAKLVFNNERSFYRVIQDIGVGQNKRKFDMSVKLAGSTTKYYRIKDHDSTLMHIKRSYLDINEFLLNVDPKHISLLNDTKQIGQYQCFLAETEFSPKYNLRLWYTTDIPGNFNISNYSNLPGLLIKIESQMFNADLVSLKEVEESALETPPTDLPKISLKEYKAMTAKVNPFKDN
jgi:GLPGLI family protein